MSTKIYYAYRVPTKIFVPEFLPAYRKHVFGKAAERVEGLAAVEDVKEELRECYDKYWTEIEVSFDDFVKEREKKFKIRSVYRKAYGASKSPYRDVYCCLDCSLNIWWRKNKFYVILYGERWLYEDFEKIKSKGWEEYVYWNNTDRPDNISGSAWQRRKDNWEPMLDNWDKSRMVHEIINVSQKIGLSELSSLMLPEELVWSSFVGIEENQSSSASS